MTFDVFMRKIFDFPIFLFSPIMNRLNLFFLGIWFFGCSKKEAVFLPEYARSQTVVFDISPSRDYTSHPSSYFFNVKLKLTRRQSSGEDIPVWDTGIHKLPVNSLGKYTAQHIFHQTNQITRILSAHYSFEYYYDDKIPVLFTSGETRLNY